MSTSIETPRQQDDDLQLLTVWGVEGDRSRRWKALEWSVGLHVAVGLLILLLPDAWFAAPPRLYSRTQITPLVAPPVQLTQPSPNRDRLSEQFKTDSVIRRERVQLPKSEPSTTRPAARRPGSPEPPRKVEMAKADPKVPAPPKPEQAKPLPSPPATPPKEQARNDRALEPARLPPPVQIAKAEPPPAIQPEEQPKLAFEDPNKQLPVQASIGAGRLQVPSGNAVQEAVKSMAPGPNREQGGIMVGDVGSGIGGIGQVRNLPPAPGKLGSNLELLSDPMGVDFRPYLIQILANVRRNWFAVMPQSAKLGRRGKVVIQFAIDRSGSVPKLVIVGPSGTEALDRAAVAGISASNPFPPLPGDFKGNQIRLQFSFQYNVN